MFVSFRKYYFAYSKKLETANVREKVVLNCTIIYAIEDFVLTILLQMPTHKLRIAVTYLTPLTLCLCQQRAGISK